MLPEMREPPRSALGVLRGMVGTVPIRCTSTRFAAHGLLPEVPLNSPQIQDTRPTQLRTDRQGPRSLLRQHSLHQTPYPCSIPTATHPSPWLKLQRRQWRGQLIRTQTRRQKSKGKNGTAQRTAKNGQGGGHRPGTTSQWSRPPTPTMTFSSPKGQEVTPQSTTSGFEFELWAASHPPPPAPPPPTHH
jgi:hypothetical protein